MREQSEKKIPCILADTVGLGHLEVRGGQRAWAEAEQIPRREVSSLQRERPPPYLSHAEENPRPLSLHSQGRRERMHQDPKHHESGSSIAQKPRISKAGNRYLRAALYMPALVAVQHDPALRAFYQRLLDHGKAKLQALVAVMRKLLHAAWGMFRNDQPYDGAKLCPQA